MSDQKTGQGPCAAYPRINILGVGIHSIRMIDAINVMACWIENRVKTQVVVCPVYTIMLSQQDAELHQILDSAGLVTPDGMPLVLLGKLMGYSEIERVYGPDLMLAFCERASKSGYTSFLYGGAEGVAEQLASRLIKQQPGLRIVGVYSPPYRDLSDTEAAEVQSMINAANPDIVWVGLGTPRQDKWIAGNREYINAPIMIGIGAAFDFISGRISQAPRWMQRGGLEWLFRLSMEPRRLWRRYLVYNPLFLINIVLQLLGLRRDGLRNPIKKESDQPGRGQNHTEGEVAGNIPDLGSRDNRRGQGE
jgi:N-acetylglucosaminyldiphosphoundecaprenol N-acetyl-beta-D-mannosaminyltransferase